MPPGWLGRSWHIRAAVASGENLTGLEQFRPLIDADAIDIVQVGSGWGITHFLRVADLAHAYDLPVSPVGYHANRGARRQPRCRTSWPPRSRTCRHRSG